MKKTKLIALALMFVVGFGMVVVGCGNQIDYTRVRVYVAESYYDKFDAKGFTLADFELYNAKEFEYRYYPGSVSGDGTVVYIKEKKFLVITLKETGRKYVNQAMEQLKKLEFAERVDYNYCSAAPGIKV